MFFREHLFADRVVFGNECTDVHHWLDFHSDKRMRKSGHEKWLRTHHQLAILRKYSNNIDYLKSAELHIICDLAHNGMYGNNIIPLDEETMSEVIESSGFDLSKSSHYQNGFEPFFRVRSSNGSQRLETSFMRAPYGKRVYVQIHDYEKHRRLGMVITGGRLLRFASGMIRALVGVTVLPISKGKMGKLLEFYFKPRRKDGGRERYVYRVAIRDCLKEGQIYAAQLQKKYGLSAMRGHRILQDMRDAGILQSKKYGGMVVYTFAVKVHEIISVLNVIDGLLTLKGDFESSKPNDSVASSTVSLKSN